jgi:SAM-dependent methyltransferase
MHINAHEEAVHMACPVCTAKKFLLGRAAFDDRYGEPNPYSLAVCDQCGHRSTFPRLNESQLPALYGTYYPRKGTQPADVEQAARDVSAPLARWSRWWHGVDNQGQYSVRPGEAMLDIGCGNGTSLLEARALGAKAYGIEADPNVRPIAEALGLEIHFGSLYDHPFPGQRFDLVVLNQVIEHLPDPDKALQLLRERLAPGGRIVLVFPNVGSLWRRLCGLRWINWHIPYHLHHFDRTGFTRMAGRCGYRVASVRSITPNLWTLLQVRAQLRPARRGVPNPLWAVRPAGPAGDADGPARAPSSRAKVAARCLVMVPLALLNRVVDTLGLGDSLLVELHPEGQA